MDKPSKILIISLAVALGVVSGIFAFYSYAEAQPGSLKTSTDLSINSGSKKLKTEGFDSPHIRVDILISAKRSDGSSIEQEQLDFIRTELATKFGGVTVLPPFNGTSISGGLRNDGVNNSGFYVVAPNTEDNIDWFTNYKQTLIQRLQQERIFMTVSPTMIIP